MKWLFVSLLVLDCTFGITQHQEKVDFIRGDVFLTPLPEHKRIDGTVTYDFEVLEDVDSVFLDAHQMDFSAVLLDGKKMAYSNSGSKITISKRLEKGEKHQLHLKYSCIPKQTVYFFGWDDDVVDNEQIWTQGQGKYTSHWLPSFDAMEEKVEFDLRIRFDAAYEVIASGTPTVDNDTIGSGMPNPVSRMLNAVNEVTDRRMPTAENAVGADSSQTAASEVIVNRMPVDTKPDFTKIKTWRFDMQHPMSSYLLAFAIGNYDKQQLHSDSGVPLTNYFYPKDSLRVEPTYRYSKVIFDFLEDEIGVSYPWGNYKQVPVHDFLYAGMENTGTTIFSDGYVIDSIAFVDKNYVNVNAHELAHQWFGNLVTEKSARHHWLHEGIATYYAYLSEKKVFGDDHFHWKLYASLTQLQEQFDKDKGESLLNPKASSLTFYEKGAWAVYMLREQLGDKAFRKGIQTYLKKYRFRNARVSEFLKTMESVSGRDLSDFKMEWLDSRSIPFEKAKQSLARHSASLRLLFKMEQELEKEPDDAIDYAEYWNAGPSIHLKKYILEKHGSALPDKMIEAAFASDSVPLRQALSTVPDIKVYPKAAFESLLNDRSYVTQENALIKLWQTYPQDKKNYLDKTKGLTGLPNKNLRLLWLTLAILTEDYQGSETKAYFDELSGYTAPQYSFEVRQGAFFYLKEVFGFTDQNLKDLLQATDHHAWQFRNFARRLLDELIQDPEYKKRVEILSMELKEEDLRYLDSTEY
ncbi:M1 family metallopeptidase [Pricia sp. S334]|uniref:Aminopeptidase N n=1 Tax=Pricia mediterranea TaxID=3076079 RepID=A0ABU3LBE6_9FLAO|nr:M1 family metallopeptidase [Pricia sp. S334]MDT7830728.1 M1 family metallopeptidase [Pricia sp. S334]